MTEGREVREWVMQAKANGSPVIHSASVRETVWCNVIR